MTRNWYVLCTQSKQEKKVAAMLTKKGIENFCPFTITETKNVSRKVREYGPLFKSYIFVNIEETEIRSVTKLPYVVNTLYWKSKPAVINADEINAIKMMVENYSVITLDRNAVNQQENVAVVERSITGYSNNVTSIRHQGITVRLPTLGYSLSTDREQMKAAPELARKESFTVSLAKKLNLLMFFGF